MNKIDSAYSPPNAYTSTPRPFQRKRHFFGRLNFSHLWERISTAFEKPKKVLDSVIGKSVVYALAETGGAIIGQCAGENVLAAICSKIGQHILMTNVVVGGTLLVFSSRINASNFKKAAMVTIVIGSAVLNKSNTEIPEYGSFLGHQFGEFTGGSLGAIVGGFFGLLLFKSPTVFWDKDKPWDSYSVSMIRFTGSGLCFDAAIKQASIPWVSPLLNIPRGVIKAVVQTSAYNSNHLFPFVKQCLQKKSMSTGSHIPLFVKMLVNSHCGHNARHFAKKLSGSVNALLSFVPNIVNKMLSIKTFSTLLVSDPIMEGLQFAPESSRLITNAALRGLYNYISILRKSDTIIAAHRNFEIAFENNLDISDYKIKLSQAIKDALNREDTTLMQGIKAKLETHITDCNKENLKGLIASIKATEVVLLGIPMMTDKQASFLNEILEIYLAPYLVYTFSNWSAFKKDLMPTEERDGLIALNNLLFNYYFRRLLPSIVATPLQKMMHLTIQTAHTLAYIFAQPEQSTYLPGEIKEENFNEDYVEDPEKARSRNFVNELKKAPVRYDYISEVRTIKEEGWEVIH